MAIDINKILDESRALGCSDLHFTVGIPPIVRQGGNLRKLSSYPDMTEIDIRGICDNMCNEKQRQSIKDHIDTDFTYVSTRGFRHRVNVYRQRGNTAIAIRLLRNDIPTLTDLDLPPVLAEFAMRPRGLVLVTGPTGSGKSTTLYAALGEIAKPNLNVITVEDPVEKKVEGKKNYYCSNRNCAFVMWKNDRFFEDRKVAFSPKIAAALLKSGKVKVKGLYSPKTGKTYDGTVILADTGGKYVNYKIELPKKK